jgi:hypothetical protein
MTVREREQMWPHRFGNGWMPMDRIDDYKGGKAASRCRNTRYSRPKGLHWTPHFRLERQVPDVLRPLATFW